MRARARASRHGDRLRSKRAHEAGTESGKPGRASVAAEAGPSDKISVITVKDSADLNLAPTKDADQVLRELGPVTDEGKTRSSTASISAWTVCSKLARRNRHS